MTIAVDEIIEMARTLPEHDRSVLASAMLESLDDDTDTTEEVHAAWTKEIGSRLDDLISGRVQGLSLEQMKARSAAALASVRR